MGFGVFWVPQAMGSESVLPQTGDCPVTVMGGGQNLLHYIYISISAFHCP